MLKNEIPRSAILSHVIIHFTLSYYIFRNPSKIPTFFSYKENTRIETVIKDAITCVNFNLNPDKFLSKTFSERKEHSEWINNQIRLIEPPPKNYCWEHHCGPWLEDVWIGLEKSDFKTFGPFVPLFVPWTKMLNQESQKIKTKKLRHKLSKYYQWRDKVLKLLKSDYFYITVSQNADGIEGRNEINYTLPKNLIVISSGGKGHIPILLFLKQYNPNDFPLVEKFEYEAVFSGYLWYEARRKMIYKISDMLGNRFLFFDKRVDWKIEYGRAKFVCAPRGYGRNSFRMAETLQSGRVPIYGYDDIIWLPYYDSINWNSFSIVANVSDLNKTIDRIINTKPKEIIEMRKKIRSLYDSHFSLNGTFNQIKLFMQFGFTKSDLRCAKYSTFN